MPFGNGDRQTLNRLTTQLGQIGETLAALQRQVTDQQHAIEQARQDIRTDLNNGLTEIRATVRDGLDRGTERTSDTLTRIGSDLGIIRDGIHRIEQQPAPAPAPPEPAPQEREPVAEAIAAPEPTPLAVEEQEPEPQPDPASAADAEPNPDILRAAAGIAHARIEAHRDTWAFLIQAAGREQHFHIPGKVESHSGFVSVRVSGPSLVAAITSLGRIAHNDPSPVTQAIAAHIHQKISDAVRSVVEHPHSGDGADPIRIVIDDRAATTEGNGQPDNE